MVPDAVTLVICLFVLMLNFKPAFPLPSFTFNKRSYHFMANRWGKSGSSDKFYFLPKSLQTVTAAVILTYVCFLDGKLRKNLESRDITLPTKVHLVKAMLFAVVIYRCDSWTIKKVEHWRIDVFKLSCWRRLLRVPWTTMRSNQSILKGINPEYSLEGLLLRLKLQYFGQLIWRANLL